MSRRPAPRAGFRLWAALALAAAAIGGAAVALGNREHAAPLPPRPEAARPKLLLITSLPLIFPEHFGIGGGSPALTALERRYSVEPIGVADAANLTGQRLLLMAHARAQPAMALVELDAWVRGGGRLLLLADPKLDWPSTRALGDSLRPPPAFADTGLLKHWGLTLYTPDLEGKVERRVDRHHVVLSSPGVLSGDCEITGDGLVAQCAVGGGKVTVIADADFLRGDDASSDSLQFLLTELEQLERR